MTRSEPGPRRPVFGVVVGHGDLPRALRDAAVAIVGQSADLAVVSNEELGSGRMDELLDRTVDEHPGAHVLMFVDMYGSSCSHASARITRSHPGTAAICGVNLAMLVRFLYYRDRLDFQELVELMRRTGVEEIRPGRA